MFQFYVYFKRIQCVYIYVYVYIYAHIYIYMFNFMCTLKEFSVSDNHRFEETWLSISNFKPFTVCSINANSTNKKFNKFNK